MAKIDRERLGRMRRKYKGNDALVNYHIENIEASIACLRIQIRHLISKKDHLKELLKEA